MNLITDPAAFNTMPTRDVPAGEFGGAVRLRIASGSDGDLMAKHERRDDESDRAFAGRFGRFVLGAFAIKADGSPLFTDPDAVPELPAALALRLTNAFFDLNDFSNGRDAEGN